MQMVDDGAGLPLANVDGEVGGRRSTEWSGSPPCFRRIVLRSCIHAGLFSQLNVATTSGTREPQSRLAQHKVAFLGAGFIRAVANRCVSEAPDSRPSARTVFTELRAICLSNGGVRKQAMFRRPNAGHEPGTAASPATSILRRASLLVGGGTSRAEQREPVVAMPRAAPLPGPAGRASSAKDHVRV
jgi:hypothetical protein